MVCFNNKLLVQILTLMHKYTLHYSNIMKIALFQHIYIYMSNIIHYLIVLIHTYAVKKSIIFILKYYSDDITHKSKNHISYKYIYTYYVGFISICNGIIGANAIGLAVLFTDCVKVIGFSGVSPYLEGD